MERHYLVHALTGEDRGFNYCTEDDEEADIEGLDVSMVDSSMSRWRQEMDHAHQLVQAQPDMSADVATGWDRCAGTW